MKGFGRRPIATVRHALEASSETLHKMRRPGTAAIPPVNLQQRKYYVHAGTAGQCQVPTIPQRSAPCAFSAIAVSRWSPRCSRRFERRRRPSSGSVRRKLVKLMYAFSGRRLRVGATTRIGWCDATFNPWVGCLRASTACDRCYAAALSWRYGWRDAKRRDLWT